jgi:FKBP-type peptidyl-prolyl cis-trans isomerase 2
LELVPEDAFGPANPEAVQAFPKGHFPASMLHVGVEGELPGPDGTRIPYRVQAIDAETVTLDCNHPLAGQQIIFEITVIHIQD